MPSDLRRLTGLAAALPAEFQTDTLLQIVESRGGLNADLKRDLIEQASTLARRAKYAYPKVAVRGLNADSRQAFEANVLSLKLDRLSLEMRAIRDLLPLDPVAARRMFQQVQKPVLEAGTCGNALVPQLDDYFEAGALVVTRGFGPKEIEREEHVALALQIVTGVKAPYEVAPAARMVVETRLAPAQFEAVLNAFTARLEAVGMDDRAFTETAVVTQTEIASVAGKAASLGVSRGTLSRAYRKYLTSHYGAARCAESPGGAGPVEWFNQSDLRGGLAVIELKELNAKAVEGKLAVDGFWTTPDSERILNGAREVRVSPSGAVYSAPERAASEWTRKLEDFLGRLGGWKQSGEESALDFFHQKATVYESLIDVCPSGERRVRLINGFVSFLNGADAIGESPVDWFWHVQNLHRRLRQAGDRDAERLMGAYRASGNLIMEVYAELVGG